MRRINFKKLILTLGIIIVLNLFFNYGVSTFYKEPKYDDYCKPEMFQKSYSTRQDCESVSGMWQTNDGEIYYPEKPMPASVSRIDSQIPQGWCNVSYICQKNFESARDVYNKNVFIILVIAGVASIIAGFSITQSEAVALGFSFGGLISLLIGTVRYWSSMTDYLRFIILGIALALLVFIGFKKLRDDNRIDERI